MVTGARVQAYSVGNGAVVMLESHYEGWAVIAATQEITKQEFPFDTREMAEAFFNALQKELVISGLPLWR